MTPDLENLILLRFADFFKGRPQHVGCDDGWFNLVWGICAEVQSYISGLEQANQHHRRKIQALESAESKYGEMPLEERLALLDKTKAMLRDVPSFKVAQVKEKFGTLRFYYDGGDAEIQGIVGLGERLSGSRCEVCGDVGKLRMGSWLKTLCDVHAQEKGRAETGALAVGSTIQAVAENSYWHYEVLEVHSETEVSAKLDEYELEKDGARDLAEVIFRLKRVGRDNLSMWVVS